MAKPRKSTRKPPGPPAQAGWGMQSKNKGATLLRKAQAGTLTEAQWKRAQALAAGSGGKGLGAFRKVQRIMNPTPSPVSGPSPTSKLPKPRASTTKSFGLPKTRWPRSPSGRQGY